MPIEADPVTIEKAATDTLAAKSVAEGELNKLRDEISALQPAWQGAAGVTFQTMMTRWDDNTTNLVKAMDTIAELLVASSTDITITDEEEQQAINKFEEAIEV